MSEINNNQDNNDQFMQAITTALETPPPVHVPNDFAARVLARAQAEPLPHAFKPAKLLPALTRTHYGQTTITAAMVILIAAMLLTASWLKASPTALTLQALFFTQLTALLLWSTHLRRQT